MQKDFLPVNSVQLLSAYASGFFPMPETTDGRWLWYKPDPRAVFDFQRFHISRSLLKSQRRFDFKVTFNSSFQRVMQACSDHHETWIDTNILNAYCRLHLLGYAQSVEVWQDWRLVGGVYGVSLGRAFFAESMFHRQTDASKWALAALCERLVECQYLLLEAQWLTPHLRSLGAIEISSEKYLKILNVATQGPQRIL